MQRLGWMVALVVIAVACSTGVDMMGEIMDSGVPDAGAQPGELIAQCDVVFENANSTAPVFFAEVAASELTGPFVAQACTDAEGGIPNVFGGSYREPTLNGEPAPAVKCASISMSGHAVTSDGRVLFPCISPSFNNFWFGFPEPGYVRIIR